MDCLYNPFHKGILPVLVLDRTSNTGLSGNLDHHTEDSDCTHHRHSKKYTQDYRFQGSLPSIPVECLSFYHNTSGLKNKNA